MELSILFRNLSPESERASMILKDNKVAFREVFTDTSKSNVDTPVLIERESQYPFKGYDNIASFAMKKQIK